MEKRPARRAGSARAERLHEIFTAPAATAARLGAPVVVVDSVADLPRLIGLS